MLFRVTVLLSPVIVNVEVNIIADFACANVSTSSSSRGAFARIFWL
jgi:hypothetical protein